MTEKEEVVILFVQLGRSLPSWRIQILSDVARRKSGLVVESLNGNPRPTHVVVDPSVNADAVAKLLGFKEASQLARELQDVSATSLLCQQRRSLTRLLSEGYRDGKGRMDRQCKRQASRTQAARIVDRTLECPAKGRPHPRQHRCCCCCCCCGIVVPLLFDRETHLSMPLETRTGSCFSE